MPAIRLTPILVARHLAAPPVLAARKWFDADLKGLYLELRPTGAASFGYRFRDARHRQRQMTLGNAARMTLAEAREAARVAARKIARGVDPLAAPAPKNLHVGADARLDASRSSALDEGAAKALTFARFALDHYLPHVRMNKRSWRTDEAILRNHLLPVLGPLPLEAVTVRDVRALQHGFVAAGAAAGTVNRRLVLLSYLYTCAARWGMVEEGVNPVRRVEALPDHGARERYLSAEESRRLLVELAAEPNRGVASLVLLLLYTGARRSEIACARWQDIDLERSLLRVPIAKSGKARHVVLSQPAVALIRGLPRHPGSDLLLPNPRTGRPLAGVFAVWQRIRTRAGLPGLRLHDLRHSYASFLVNAGRSLYEVQHLLGHANPRTTMRYAHLSQATLQEAANLVGSLLQPA